MRRGVGTSEAIALPKADVARFMARLDRFLNPAMECRRSLTCGAGTTEIPLAAPSLPPSGRPVTEYRDLRPRRQVSKARRGLIAFARYSL